MFVTGKSVKCTYTSFTEMVTMEIYTQQLYHKEKYVNDLTNL